MMRRILTLVLAAVSLTFLNGPADAGGHHDQGSIYERGPYDNRYEFVDDSCGFEFHLRGRARGFSTTYNVPGSDGQAFLLDDYYSFFEVLTNPANGKRMYISGWGHLKEVKATHVEGDVWEFIAVDSGTPFVVRDKRGRLVLKDQGKLVYRQVFDTLGDSEPGGEELDFEVLSIRGHFPSLAPDFDFCAMVSDLIG